MSISQRIAEERGLTPESHRRKLKERFKEASQLRNMPPGCRVVDAEERGRARIKAS